MPAVPAEPVLFSPVQVLSQLPGALAQGLVDLGRVQVRIPDPEAAIAALEELLGHTGVALSQVPHGCAHDRPEEEEECIMPNRYQCHLICITCYSTSGN